MRWIVLGLAALALTGCETTQEKSAALEKIAAEHAASAPAPPRALKITLPSRVAQVLSTRLVRDSEGAAAIVTVRNRSATAQRELPLKLTVAGAGGSTLYTNTTSGLGRSLISLPYLPAHGVAVWVDDQIQLNGSALRAVAKIGEGARQSEAAPQLTLSGGRLESEAGELTAHGTIVNHSSIAQHEIIVDGVVEAHGHAVAAGRAVIATLAPGASSSFQIYVIGSASAGARLRLSASPTTFD